MRDPDPQRICGPNAVRALFLRRPQDVLRLFFDPERAAFAEPLARHMARTRRIFREVWPEELARVAGTQHHGGIVAIAVPKKAEFLDGPLPPILWSAPLLPVLDGIGNPHNLGAILRSAAFFGARAVILGDDPRQADLSDAAFRTSEGAVEHLTVFRTDSLPSLLRRLEGRVLPVAAVAAGGVPPAQVPFGKPVALVLGNEETGPNAAVLDACAGGCTLPALGPVESLNVSAAAAVLFHAFAGRAA